MLRNGILSRLRRTDPIFRVLILFVVVINLMWLAGFLSLISKIYAFSVLILLCLVSCLLFDLTTLNYRKLRRCYSELLGQDMLFKFMFILTVVFFLTSLIRTFAPVTSGDVLAMRMNNPKRYIDKGGFVNLPYNRASNIPMATEMLYMFSMLLGRDIFAQIMAWVISLLLFIAIYRFGEEYIDRQYGLIAACIVMATIPFHMDSFWAYQDLNLALFSFASFWALLKFGKTRDIIYLFYFGVFAGTTLGAKMNGVIFIVVIYLYFVFFLTRYDYEQKLKLVLIPTVLSVAAYLPWLIKAYMFTGNPVYPFFSSIINMKWPYSDIKWSVVGGKSVWFHRHNLTLFRAARDIGPLFLIGILLSIFLRFWNQRLLRVFFILSLSVFAFYFVTDPEPRFMFVIFLLLAFIAAFGFMSVFRKGKNHQRIICYSILIGWLMIFVGKTSIEKAKAYPVVFGLETEAEFHRSYEYGFRWYDDFAYINNNTPKSSKILVFDPSTYYLDREYISVEFLELGIIDLSQIDGGEKFHSWLRSNKVTHVWFDQEDYHRPGDTVMRFIQDLIEHDHLREIFHNEMQNSYIYELVD